MLLGSWYSGTWNNGLGQPRRLWWVLCSWCLSGYNVANTYLVESRLQDLRAGRRGYAPFQEYFLRCRVIVPSAWYPRERGRIYMAHTPPMELYYSCTASWWTSWDTQEGFLIFVSRGSLQVQQLGHGSDLDVHERVASGLWGTFLANGMRWRYQRHGKNDVLLVSPFYQICILHTMLWSKLVDVRVIRLHAWASHGFYSWTNCENQLGSFSFTAICLSCPH